MRPQHLQPNVVAALCIIGPGGFSVGIAKGAETLQEKIKDHRNLTIRLVFERRRQWGIKSLGGVISDCRSSSKVLLLKTSRLSDPLCACGSDQAAQRTSQGSRSSWFTKVADHNSLC